MISFGLEFSSPVAQARQPGSLTLRPAVTAGLPASFYKSEVCLSSGVRVQCRSSFLVKSTGQKTAGAPTEVTVAGSAVADADPIVQVTHETFSAELGAAGEKLVVLDMYTQWCGPCKVMYPKVCAFAKENRDIVFLKLDCNQENKALAKELGVKVVPTFKLLKHGEVVDEVVGAKMDQLLEKIAQHRQ